MRILFICLSAFVIGALSEDEDDGQYHPEKYLGPDGDSGLYVHDNSGQYISDNSGLYRGDRTGEYKGQLSKYRGGGGFGGGAGSKGRFSSFAPTNQLRNFNDDFQNRKSGSDLLNFQQDQFPSSTFAPIAKILHRKPLQGIKDVEFLRNPSPNKPNDFFGDIPSGTSFEPKTTHSALRSFPVKYNQGRSDDSRWRILKQNGDVGLDGYHWDFETENGIQAEETGKLANKGSDLEAMRARGFYKYTGPDNKVYSVTYTADENGFIAQGNHLPTPPPIPSAILKSLDYQRGSGPQRGKF